MLSQAFRPNVASYQARVVRLGMPKSAPGTSFDVRNAFMRANRRHGPSSPRGLRSTMRTFVIRSSRKPNAMANPHIENRHAVARLRIGPFPRRISQIGQLASNPIGQLGNAHVHAFEYEGR